MHTRMQAGGGPPLAGRVLTLPPIVIGVTLLLMYALEGFLTLRELLVCELFCCSSPLRHTRCGKSFTSERAAQYGVTMVAAKAATAEKSIKISEERSWIVIFLLPQSNWCSEEGNPKLSLLRNTVFAVTGIGVIILYALSGNTYGYHMTRMVAA